MTVRDLISELERLVAANPQRAQAEVRIARDFESLPLFSDDFSFAASVIDPDIGSVLGHFLEITTWS